MKKNLVQPETRAEIIARLEKLTPSAKNEWGKMNVNQMLRHTTFGLLNAMDEMPVAPGKSGGFKKALMRFVIMKTNMPTPKGKAETFKEFNTVEQGINPDDFRAEREALKSALKRFPDSSKYGAESPLIGTMSREDWGRLNYGHLDHHLKQFGV